MDEDITGTMTESNLCGVFDSIIARINRKNVPEAEAKRLKAQVVTCILSIAGCPVEEGGKPEEVCLEALKGRSLANGDTVAVCFLRLLLEPSMGWTRENPWRPAIVSLFDTQFQESIYREKNISIDSMGHEKQERLARIVDESEKYFQNALQLLVSLELAAAQRQKMMQVLNSRVHRILIRPFLLPDIEGRLSEIYERVQDYLSRRNDPDTVDIALEVTDVIQRLDQDLDAMGTIYGRWIRTQVCKKLLSFIERDIADNDAAKAARVLIVAPNRKYPLDEVDSALSVEIVVKNEGPGYAYDVRLSGIGEGITVQDNDVQIGKMLPGTSQLVQISAKLVKNDLPPVLLLEGKWRNCNKSWETVEGTFRLASQKSGIDWERLSQTDPYSLLPVDTEKELVGRKEVLDRLLAVVTAQKPGSCIIRGQKRVGKTSIAKALQSHLEQLKYIVVYLDSGDYVRPEATGSIANLGTKVATSIVKLDPRLAHLPIPTFTDAISPLSDFLDEATRCVPERRIVVMLDEFDWLPFDVYRGVLGDSFFLSLRSISARPNVSFVIVGGEKITRIMEYQGMQLNRWISIYVDYFNRETDWSDYRELIQRPTSDVLEYTEDAIISLYEATAGNPYFTKLVCQHLFQQAISSRDCFVSGREVEKAIKTTVRADKTDVNTFAHFWDDGIFEEGERARDKSLRRRKVLIAVSDTLRIESPAPKAKISEHRFASTLPSLDSDLNEFASRGVLIASKKGDTYDFKVPLFHSWLRGKGVFDIIAQIHDLDAILSERKKEEETRVQPNEILAVVQQWGTYRGQLVTEEMVRNWLGQFETVDEQRSMFAILQGLRFYSDGFARKKMMEAHDVVKRGLTRYMGTAKRSDIIVSYVDGVGKSGAHFARLYADEVQIYVANVIEKSQLAPTLKSRTNVQAIVFIDDFVGTGQTAISNLKTLHTELEGLLQEKNIRMVFVTLVACLDGWTRLQMAVEKLSQKIEVHACEVLDESSKCFTESSSMFRTAPERIFARETATKYGSRLEKKRPLGYDNLQMAVVFEYGCPNNSLPILWKESPKERWRPLFKRS
ncbi:MAG: ATP-binding protein [Chloroflexi bacterium]|nr:ATP-binding protein [Chloroflexota bacterium]